MANEKRFDAVKMMREIRDELSRKLMTMSHEEQGAFIEVQLRRREPSDELPSWPLILAPARRSERVKRPHWP